MYIFSVLIFGPQDPKISYKGVDFYKKNAKENEFRGVWIATVANINWPKNTEISSREQRGDFKDILKEVKQMNMNAVIVQVRPCGDALYKSKNAPWSTYLTGTQGKYPGYDPLKFMIKESHRRGIEFHAWFNPYRIALNDDEFSSLSEDNFAVKNPETVIKYGTRYYLDPGIPKVREYLIKVVLEVVDNYDIDAVHIDDYFYPYTIEGLDFPDSETYTEYGSDFSSVEEWRRENINNLVEELHKGIKQRKKEVKFGISPFGVWRNYIDDKRGSQTEASQRSYDTLYADVLKWVDMGWVDYIIPQVYWNFGFQTVPYEKLVRWWVNETEGKGVKLYIGHGAYKLGQENWENPDELVNQIYYNRSLGIGGSAFFGLNPFLENVYDLKNRLKKEVYKN
jgi:uncharacterized lipoprotein YddW (UPF0748 family)